MNSKREIVLENLAAAVEQNGVHAHRAKGIASPPHFDVDSHVIKRQEEVSEAALEEDEGQTPEVLVDRNDSVVLAEAAQAGGDEAFNYTPHPQPSQSSAHVLVMHEHSAASQTKPNEERSVESADKAFGVIKDAVIHLPNRLQKFF